MTNHSDNFHRFYFENLGIRGEWVQLNKSWISARGNTLYPPAIASQLGQALAAVLLLSGTIKFNGSLILQIQGSGPLQTLVAQATHTRTIRGLAHYRDVSEVSDPADLFGTDARLVLTIQNEGQTPYQGIVAVEGHTLSAAIESYFTVSEQLPTRIWLFADDQKAGGLFLQVLPGKSRDPDDWNRINMLADTITEAELLNLPVTTLLTRVFHEENVVIAAAEPVTFRCGCSPERIDRLLLGMGLQEAEALIEQNGEIEIHCDFCNKRYVYDQVDVGALFSGSSLVEPPARPQ